MAADGTTRGRLGWPLAVISVGALAFAAAWAMSWGHAPVPFLHDEFSNLLVADTLRHGRLANPRPEVWQPFQTFHVLVEPAYASKYPLGPGALLAIGWTLGGSPAVGIWLGAALCAAAATWAAAGCLPRRWAWIAGVLLAIHPSVHREWSLSFLNGYLTAAAGGLVAGAILRLRRRYRSLDALALGVGVSGLALTRPFEGLLLTLTAAGLLLFWWRSLDWSEQLRRALRIGLVAGWPVAATLALIAVHNHATTGRATQLAYQLHEAKYAVAPLSIFQREKVPEMSRWAADAPPEFFDFHYGWSRESYLRRSHFAGWCGAVAERLYVVASLWGGLFCLASVSLVSRRSARGLRPLAVAVGVALLAGTFVPWYFSHYFAPSLVWMVILTTAGLRAAITRLVSDRSAVRWGIGALVAMQAVFMACAAAEAVSRPTNWSDQRQWLVDDLTRRGGQHLILVRYHPQHNVHHEWVYNLADLQSSPVLWARSWRRDLDAQLLAHYPERQLWLLEIDQHDRARLKRFAPESSSRPVGAPAPLHPGDTIH